MLTELKVTILLFNLFTENKYAYTKLIYFYHCYQAQFR